MGPQPMSQLGLVDLQPPNKMRRSKQRDMHRSIIHRTHGTESRVIEYPISSLNFKLKSFTPPSCCHDVAARKSALGEEGGGS